MSKKGDWRAGMSGRGVTLAVMAGLTMFTSAACAEETPPAMSDWNGARIRLRENAGVTIALNYIGETLGVVSGGINRKASYEGRFEFSADTDLDTFAGLKGASAHVTVFQIHNSGSNAAANAGSIADPSNIDAGPTTRLFTLWYQQNFWDDRVSLRLGQLAADDEFLTSETAGGLINGTFGWAGIAAANITTGGAAYPLATPGIRLQINPTETVSLLGAVFSGDPAGRNCATDPQICNRHGTTFSFSGGALWIGEAQYRINAEQNATGLPGVYKLGAWVATADYADQRFGLDGGNVAVSLADPSAVSALQHRGNWGIYGAADQAVWRSGTTSVSMFLRGGIVPSDRNLISGYVDGGIGIKGLFSGRDDDRLTFGVAHAWIGSHVRALDQDTLLISGSPYPIRDGETVFEVSYIAQLAPYWTLQPDLQVIVHPGGRVPDPNNPAIAIKNAVVVGMRSTINF